MSFIKRRIKPWSYQPLVLAVFAFSIFAQQNGSALRGRVKDQFGGLVVGVTVTVIDDKGTERTATSNDQGIYVFTGLAPGKYTLRASAPGFALYQRPAINLTPGRAATLNVTLAVMIAAAEVTIEAAPAVSTQPEDNASAIVLKGSDLDALPDDPEELAQALQALVGPSSGPQSGQVFIDGFSGGPLPPKASIREIRINSNPYSAEYDRPGFGRILILTKPGTDKLRGQASFSFNDESMNARNSFAPNRPAYQRREFDGNLGGPIRKGKASFFFDFQRGVTDDNDVINAIILNQSLQPTLFSQSVLTPAMRTTFSPRIDYQLNANNTLVGRYSFSHSNSDQSGIGGFNLLSRAYDSSNMQQTLQLTETAIINKQVVNETRFQYSRQRSRQEGDNRIPTISVLDAFTGGGAQVGLSFNNDDRAELQNHTSWTWGNHSLKAGARRELPTHPQLFAE